MEVSFTKQDIYKAPGIRLIFISCSFLSYVTSIPLIISILSWLYWEVGMIWFSFSKPISWFLIQLGFYTVFMINSCVFRYPHMDTVFLVYLCCNTRQCPLQMDSIAIPHSHSTLVFKQHFRLKSWSLKGCLPCNVLILSNQREKYIGWS